MSEKLRKLKPIIHDINKPGGRPDPRMRVINSELPVKYVGNTRNNMELLEMYSKGILKWENTGRVCGECVNYYPDPKTRYGGRCKAYGFKEVHPETPADDRKDWTHPIEGINIKNWIGCPTFLRKERLSRK